MTLTHWLQFGLLVLAVVATTRLLGPYLAAVLGGGAAPGDRLFVPLERLVYRLVGIDDRREQRWNTYALSVLALGLVSVLALFALQRVQGWLPLNPTGVPNVPAPLAFNTAVSFVTGTNWQNYAGEESMSHLTQMSGLAVQNFLAAAVGMSVAAAFVRGLARRRVGTVGNFWVDLTRSVVRVLLPLSAVLAVLFLSQGVVQNLDGNTVVTTVEGANQAIPGGPVASQEAIKVLGTNGGGFFAANSAHPFENPNPLTNLVQLWAMLSMPFALTYAYGRMVRDQRQGWVLFAAMFLLWIASAALAMSWETSGNPRLTEVGAAQQLTGDQAGGNMEGPGGNMEGLGGNMEGPGGNMEGKEVRFGSSASGLFAATTTGTSAGAVNSQHDSFTPRGGAVPLVNMMLGGVSPGGVGSGLYGMLIFVLLAVFVAGLMVGRTPEYLGKKIQVGEMKLVMLYLLVVPLAVLGFAGASVVVPAGVSAIQDPGPHGLTEVVYAFASAGNNNGSAFGGLAGDTDWYNTTLGLAMLMGRFLPIVAVLAIAGSLVRKQALPPSAGTFATGTPLFAGLTVGIVVVVVGLTYFPVLALGPIAEQLGI